MKFFYSVLIVPLLSVVGLQTANAQPASLASIDRLSKVTVTFPDPTLTSFETSTYAQILPDPLARRFNFDSSITLKLPKVPSRKATVYSKREFILDARTYCSSSPVDYLEIRRYKNVGGKDWGTIESAWRKSATPSKPCPSVIASTNITNTRANATGPGNNDGTTADDESLIDYTNIRTVDVGSVGRAGWEALVKYKNGKVLKLRFLAPAA